jgi:thiosulfate/3-mercaptopyruvate sulfurtransferase
MSDVPAGAFDEAAATGARTMSYPRAQYLTTPEELIGMHAHDQSLRVLDATVFLIPGERGYRAESGLDRYREAHIPQAAFMDLIRRFSDTGTGLGFTAPQPDDLSRALGELGVHQDHRVVVYSSGHMMWATRAFWLLRYAGHDRVSVLDGGLAGWRDAGGAVASGEEHYPPTEFAAMPRRELLVGLEETRDAMDDRAVCLVNALSPEVYAGTGAMHYGRRGHIPGSVNLHYDRLMDGNRFRPADDLRQALEESGMLQAPRVITYCGGGISATIDAFACLLLGKDDVAVYDGSMSEWVRDESLPLREGPAP